MKLAPRQRFRVDRAGLEALCQAWVRGEHGGDVEWEALPPETQRDIAAQVKAVLKRQHAQTPGELQVLTEAPAQTAQSATRALERKARLALLERMPTRQLLRLLDGARNLGFVDEHGEPFGRAVPGYVLWSADELRAVLATREHLPNGPERAAARRAKALAAKHNRARAPRR